MRISVIGTGYLGAVHAACMAELGHDVLGVDTDERKIADLSKGRAPFYEPGLADMLVRMAGTGRLRFSTSLEEAARFAEVHFICVGTPQLSGRLEADLHFVEAVIRGLGSNLSRDSLVVGKSTVPVGTAARLAALLNSLTPEGINASLAWNPEFLREGFAIHDTLHPDRIVAGTVSSADDEVLRSLYEPLITAGVPYVATDLATAELAKVAANAFLAAKISFINAVADVCEAAGADVITLADSLGYDTRIGRRFLSAGLGFGGGCLSKDIRAFIARATELGVAPTARLLEQVDEINTARRQRAVDIARELVGGTFVGQNVAVLGVAFKPDTDDVRDSPALSVAETIHAEGAKVIVHDPMAIATAKATHPQLTYSDNLVQVFQAADLILHLTEWRQYRELNPVELVSLVRTPRILDARNTLPISMWRIAGWQVRSMGVAWPRQMVLAASHVAAETQLGMEPVSECAEFVFTELSEHQASAR